MPGIAEAAIAVSKFRKAGAAEAWRNARTRRRHMTHQLIGIELLREIDASLASLHPGHGSRHAEIALTEQDRSAFDGKLIAFHQRTVSAQVTQFDRNRSARQLEAGGHQHVGPARLAILGRATLVHGRSVAQSGKVSFNEAI